MWSLHYIFDIHLAKLAVFVARLVGKGSSKGDRLTRGTVADELVPDIVLELIMVLDEDVDKLRSGCFYGLVAGYYIQGRLVKNTKVVIGGQ